MNFSNFNVELSSFHDAILKNSKSKHVTHNKIPKIECIQI
jgi:hypothetical protein